LPAMHFWQNSPAKFPDNRGRMLLGPEKPSLATPTQYISKTCIRFRLGQEQWNFSAASAASSGFAGEIAPEFVR
jgi:hypothetical protein